MISVSVMFILFNHLDDPALASSDYDSTYETNHSDSSNFAQNEDDGDARRKPFDMQDSCGTFQVEARVLQPLIAPEVICSYNV